MKVTIDLENLEHLVEQVTENNIETIIKEQVESIVKGTVECLAKELIENVVSKNFQNFVDDYIKTTIIKVGGRNYWDDEEEKEYTVEQYIKKELKDRLESQSLIVYKNDRTSCSNNHEKVTFEDYIKRTFNVDDIIKKI